MRVPQPQPTTTSKFVNNFWGSSPEKSFDIITTRIKDSVNTLTEITKFYEEKVSIEKEYTRKLEKLQHKFPLGSHETGRTKVGLEKLETENQTMIDNNHKFIKTVSRVNLERLQTFLQLYSQRVRRLEHHMGKVLVKRQQALKELNHYKTKFHDECNQLKSLRLSLQTTWGRELDKNQAKFNRINAQVATTRQNYQIALVNFKEINDIYKRDWSISLNDFYKLEIERINVIKINCFDYCNNVATLCVDQDQAVDLARQSLAPIHPQSDIEEFSRNYGTGNKIYDDPEFVDYMTGREEQPIGYTVSNFASPEPANQPTRRPPPPPIDTQRPHLPPPSDDESNPADVFSKAGGSSNGSSDYSSWTFPRRREKEINEIQERISRRASTTTTKASSSSSPTKPATKVPIASDFSIDFIAQALEDLNSGGDGDVNSFRRSLRNVDTIDDHTEVAKPYEPRVATAVARYSFKPQQEGELGFKKGWKMNILHKQQDNWFVCELGDNCGKYAGAIGLVPGNYVVEV